MYYVSFVIVSLYIFSIIFAYRKCMKEFWEKSWKLQGVKSNWRLHLTMGGKRVTAPEWVTHKELRTIFFKCRIKVFCVIFCGLFILAAVGAIIEKHIFGVLWS